MMKLDRRYWPWGVLLLGGLIFAVLILTRPRQKAPLIKAQAWQVEAMVVHPHRLNPLLTLYGEVQSSQLMHTVASDRSRVVAVSVKEGQLVKQGETLVNLDPRDFKPKVIKAKAEVMDLEAQVRLERLRYSADLQGLEHEKKLLTLLKTQVDRVEKLRRRNLGSEAALDQARMDMERQLLAVTARQLEVNQHSARTAQLEARLEQAKATFAEAELSFERSQVKAPFDGIVSEVQVAVGDDVQENQPLVSLYPQNELEVRAKIPSPYQNRILQTLEKNISLSAQGESIGLSFGLKLSRLSGQAKAGGLDALFRIVDGGQHLRLGVPVTVTLARPARDHAIPVPYSALYGSDRVYRIKNGHLESVKVNPLGDYPHEGGNWLLIQSRHLKQDDLILVTHLPAAADGLAVKVKLLGAGA